MTFPTISFQKHGEGGEANQPDTGKELPTISSGRQWTHGEDSSKGVKTPMGEAMFQKSSLHKGKLNIDLSVIHEMAVDEETVKSGESSGSSGSGGLRRFKKLSLENISGRKSPGQRLATALKKSPILGGESTPKTPGISPKSPEINSKGERCESFFHSETLLENAPSSGSRESEAFQMNELPERDHPVQNVESIPAASEEEATSPRTSNRIRSFLKGPNSPRRKLEIHRTSSSNIMPKGAQRICSETYAHPSHSNVTLVFLRQYRSFTDVSKKNTMSLNKIFYGTLEKFIEEESFEPLKPTDFDHQIENYIKEVIAHYWLTVKNLNDLMANDIDAVKLALAQKIFPEIRQKAFLRNFFYIRIERLKFLIEKTLAAEKLNTKKLKDKKSEFTDRLIGLIEKIIPSKMERNSQSGSEMALNLAESEIMSFPYSVELILDYSKDKTVRHILLRLFNPDVAIAEKVLSRAAFWHYTRLCPNRAFSTVRRYIDKYSDLWIALDKSKKSTFTWKSSFEIDALIASMDLGQVQRSYLMESRVIYDRVAVNGKEVDASGLIGTVHERQRLYFRRYMQMIYEKEFLREAEELGIANYNPFEDAIEKKIAASSAIDLSKKSAEDKNPESVAADPAENQIKEEEEESSLANTIMQLRERQQDFIESQLNYFFSNEHSERNKFEGIARDILCLGNVAGTWSIAENIMREAFSGLYTGKFRAKFPGGTIDILPQATYCDVTVVDKATYGDSLSRTLYVLEALYPDQDALQSVKEQPLASMKISLTIETTHREEGSRISYVNKWRCSLTKSEIKRIGAEDEEWEEILYILNNPAPVRGIEFDLPSNGRLLDAYHQLLKSYEFS